MAIGESLLAKAGEGLIKDIYTVVKGKAKAGYQKFDWHTAQIHYYQKIEKDYGFTRIIGKHEPIPLEGIFTDVFLLDKPTAFRRFDIVQLQSDSESIRNDQKRLSGLEMVKEGKLNRLYILGKPGAGKTTFLRYVALKAAQNEIKKIPIFVSLYDWAKSGLELMPYIVKQFDICCFPDSQPLIEYILKMGLAIVLFDGLDETKQEDGKRDIIIDSIREFSRKYDESQILITCRIAATDYTFEEFTYVEVADFTEEQVKKYVEKWFSYDEEKQNNFKAEFNRTENERLREMANTPLLLSLLCLNFEVTRTFPNRRVEIYEEGINALLSKWDSSRNIIRDEIYKGLSLGRKRQMFARIAAQTFENNEYFLSKNKLTEMIVNYLSLLPDAPPKEDIDGDAVLKAIEAQHSIFIERAKDIYSFSHLTFQEYFTAKYIVDNAANGTIKRLLIKKNIVDDRWREVIINTASLLDDADSFFGIFQKVVDRIISKEQILIDLLIWAETKSPENLMNRLIYLYVQSIYSLTLKFENGFDIHYISNGELPVSNEINSYSEIKYFELIILEINFINEAKHVSSDLEYIHSRLTTNPNIQIIDLDRQYLDIYVSINFLANNSLNNRKAEYTIIKKLYNLVLKRTEKFDKDMYQSLKKLSFPNEDSGVKEWEFFRNNLLQLIQQYRNILLDLNIDKKEFNKFSSYIQANKLLFDCLKVGAGAKRQEIENKLLTVNREF